MKKIVCLFLTLVMSVTVCAPTLAFANEYEEYDEYECEHEHEYSSISQSMEHPHKGEAECECGDIIYFDYSFIDDCQECRKSLCRLGIHNYSDEILWDDNNCGYAICVCGEEEYFEEGYEEEELVLRYNNKTRFLNRQHPHDGWEVFDNGDEKYIEDYFLEDCLICTYQDMFWNDVEDYNDFLITNYGYSSKEYSEKYTEYPKYSDDDWYDYEWNNEYVNDYEDVYQNQSNEQYFDDNDNTQQENNSFTISVSSSVTNDVTIGDNKYHFEDNYQNDDVKGNIEHNVSFSVKEEYICEEPEVEEVQPNFSTNKTSPSNKKNNNRVLENGPIFYSNYIQDEYMKIPLAKERVFKFSDVVDQTLLGNWSGKSTFAGTVGEVILALAGLDPWKDISDLVYDITHWKNSKNHYINTGLDLLALEPIIGAAKKTDDIALLNKTTKNYSKFTKTLSKITDSDVLKLMKYADGHTLTKHIGNVTFDSLNFLRKGNRNISSFYKQSDAVNSVRKALRNKNNISKIANEVSNGTSKFAIEVNMGKNIGCGLFAGSNKVKDVKRVRVILKQDGKGGVYVLTAFPVE